jgi:hypothetical protein
MAYHHSPSLSGTPLKVAAIWYLSKQRFKKPMNVMRLFTTEATAKSIERAYKTIGNQVSLV